MSNPRIYLVYSTGDNRPFSVLTEAVKVLTTMGDYVEIWRAGNIERAVSMGEFKEMVAPQNVTRGVSRG